MRLVILAEGFHPPWTEGSRNALLGWLASISLYRSVNALVFTTLDPKDAEPTLKDGIDLHLNNLSNIHIRFIAGLYNIRNFFYRVRPPTRLGSWQRFVESYTYITSVIPTFMGVRAVKLMLSRSIMHEIPLILHNPGPFTIKQLLSSHLLNNLGNIVITLTFAEVSRLRSLLAILAKVTQGYSSNSRLRIVASSPYIKALIRAILSTYKIEVRAYTDVLVALPIPMLGSIIRELGLNKFITSIIGSTHKLLDYVIALTEKYDHVVLYMGQLNEVRFPSSLLMRLCRALRRLNSAILVIAPPSHQSRAYLSRIKMHGKPFNLHVLLHPLDPDTKERVLELVDLVILPYRADGRSVVDPPLALLESLAKGKPMITFSTASVRTLIKLVGLAHIILPKTHEEFVDRVVDILNKQERYGEYTNTMLRSLTDPSVVGMTLIKALCN